MTDHPDHNHSHDGHSHDGHSHGHGHGPGHVHAPATFDRAFLVGIVLNTLIVVTQVIFGVAANSLALVADAAHNFSDVIALVLAFAASRLARRGPTARFTYGYRKSTVLAALANAGMLLVAMGGILWEAIQRLINPEPVASGTVIGVAIVAIVVNAGTAYAFMRGREGDLNIRGAYLHMAGDAAVSVGVVVAALLIRLTGWLWIDALTGIAIALLILWSSWGLARDSLRLALDAVPSGLDRQAVETYLRSLPGVTEVHDVHIWAMSTTDTALTAHLVRPHSGLDDAFLVEASRAIDHRFKINHVTLQVERDGSHCKLAPDEIV